VNWSASCTTKGIKHLNLCENMVRERHQAGQVMVVHIPGIINPSDIFTKEMKDATHFRRLRDYMMVSKSAFLKYTRPVPTVLATAERILPYYSLRSQLAPPSLKPTANPTKQPASQPLSRGVSTRAFNSVSESPESRPTFFLRDHVTRGCWGVSTVVSPISDMTELSPVLGHVSTLMSQRCDSENRKLTATQSCGS